MNKKSKAAVAAVTALVVGSVSMFSVSAETYKVQINCPYMNLTVMDSDGEIPEGLELKLVDAEGTAVAEWTVGDEKNACVSDNVLNISGGMNKDIIYSGDYSFDISDYPTGVGEEDIISVWLEDAAASVIDPTELKVGESYNLNVKYKDETAMEGVDLTVPAGNYYVAVDEKYENRVIKSMIQIRNPNDSDDKTNYFFNDNYGELVNGQAESGTYELWLACTDLGNEVVRRYVGDEWILDVSEDPVDYKKVTFNISEIADGRIDPDGTFSYESKDGEKKFDLKSGMLDDNRCDFYFVSGSVITAAIPDENGNVSVYVNKNDGQLGFAMLYDMLHGENIISWYGGYEPKSVKTAAVIDTSIEIPADALTLYDIPAGEYTVTTDSTEYTIEDNTIEISDTKDIQTFEVEVIKQSENSSQSSAADESSSADSSSNTDSSSDDSDISSLAESSVSQSGNSSAVSSTSAGKNDSNPNTGAAAGRAAVLVVIGGAVVTAVKKKNK